MLNSTWHGALSQNYRKFPKYLYTQNICCNQSKIWTMWLYNRVMSLNDADGMANSVDPDQTAPLGAVWSGSALFAQAYLPRTYDHYGKLDNIGIYSFLFTLYAQYQILQIVYVCYEAKHKPHVNFLFLIFQVKHQKPDQLWDSSPSKCC